MTVRTEQSLPPGTRFGGYEVVRLIGSGGMGAVYEATHLRLRKAVALKTMHPRVIYGEEILTRFLREGETAAKIRHPHVVDVSDLGIKDQIPFLVMELLTGETLAAVLERERFLSIARTVDTVLPVLSAVHAAHDAGVLHRDLKPENIFMQQRRGGQIWPKVLDFGISRMLDEQKQMVVSDSAVVFGTPHYMSPEQAVGGVGIDSRADIYAVGVILYECLAGVKPFHGDTLFSLFTRVVNEDPPPPSSRRAGLPDVLDEIVLRAIQRDRDKRFVSAQELGRALFPFASDTGRATWEREFGGEARPSQQPSGPVAGRPKSFDALTLVGEKRPVVERNPSANSASFTAMERRANDSTSARRFSKRTLIGAGAAVAALFVAFATTTLRTPAAPATDGRTLRRPVASEVAHPRAAPRYRVHIVATPAFATITLDGRARPPGELTAELVRDGTAHVAEVSAPGFQSQSLSFSDTAPPEHVTLVRLETAAGGAAAEPAAHPPSIPGSAAHAGARALNPAGAAASNGQTSPAAASRNQPLDAQNSPQQPIRSNGANGSLIME